MACNYRPRHRCKSHLPWRERKSLRRITRGPAPVRERFMRRRDFILLGSAVALPLVAQAQVSPKRRPLIAWLSGGTTEVVEPFAASFLDGMRELNYVEGRDFDMAYRFAEGSLDRVSALAEEIVRLKPDVILAAAVSAAVPARKATSA